ncbi:Heavy metal-associated isoprenylated plant protein 33 [Cardamine amara subsp. amara]|uniref:Heavy metal-associated isoprenylated plant protein 33 n=1 Tax=Cardamine amara subsp. amara TaxID=228776 RepID=A0ABD0Z1Q0_CARAN
MESSSNHMACLLKIESPTPGWRNSLKKLLETINDVNFMIDKRSKTIYVSGKIDPQIILEKIIKSGKNAIIVWSNNGQNKPPENRKDNLMEQYYHVSPGLMNVPNGFSNYPPPCMMNYQSQPHYQHFAPPPPYPRQVHPQPPPPPPYQFHESKPVAKSFPPTPPPPKNFVMGDLQLGCIIM